MKLQNIHTYSQWGVVIAYYVTSTVSHSVKQQVSMLIVDFCCFAIPHYIIVIQQPLCGQ